MQNKNDDSENTNNLKWFTNIAAVVVLLFLVAILGAIAVAAWKWAIG